MDALITALSNDPAARPTAAAFGEQLAKVPALRTSPRDVRVGDEEATWGMLSRRLPSGSGQSATPKSRSYSVDGGNSRLAAISRAAAADAPRWRGKLRILALATALVTVTAPATAWLISDPASSAVPAATTPFTGSSEKSATVTARKDRLVVSVRSGASGDRAEQHLTTCREKLRAGDTVIKRAKIGVSNLSERVQARTDPNSGTVDLEEAMRSLTPEGAAEPNEVKRYKAAVKAYGDRRQACQHVAKRPSKSPPN